MNETSKKKDTKGNKNYTNYKSTQNSEGGYYNNYYQTATNGNYNSYYKKPYNKNYTKNYNEENQTERKEGEETNIATNENGDNWENVDAADGLNNGTYYKKNYYNNYNTYNTRGYMRGRGRARGRGQMRGGRNYEGGRNYSSYNYNNREDVTKIIEKDLNTEEIVEVNVEETLKTNTEKPSNSNSNLTQAQDNINKDTEKDITSNLHQNQQNLQQEKIKSPNKSPTKEKISHVPLADELHQTNNKQNVNHLDATQSQKTNTVQINKFENTTSEKQNIFNNDNTNSSKLKNLIEDVETESIEKPSQINTHVKEHSDTTHNNKQQQTRQQITYSKESQENINFGITGQQKKNEEHTIKNESSFVFFSKPAQKPEQQIINTQTENFNYTAQNQNNQSQGINNQNQNNSQNQNNINNTQQNNKFNTTQPSKNQGQGISSQQNSQTQQINANNSSAKNLSQQQPSNINMNLNQQPNNKPDLNMQQQGQPNANVNPNLAFNPLMANQNMYFGMGGEGVYPGANQMQPGYMPYFWYYNPANQAVGNDPSQAVPQQPQPHNFPQNAGMPFMPYAMPYYFNPMMYQQGEAIKEDPAGKTRKNNFYTNPTGYPGINQAVNKY